MGEPRISLFLATCFSNHLKIQASVIIYFQLLLERLFWTLSLTLLIYSLTTELTTVFREDKEIKIVTSITLKPIEEVSFPTIVFNSGGPIDPLGFVKNSHNMAVEEDIPVEGKVDLLVEFARTISLSRYGSVQNTGILQSLKEASVSALRVF